MNIVRFFFILGIFTNLACASSTVTFTAEYDAKLALVPGDKPFSPGKDLGKMPAEVPLSDLEGSIVRVSGGGEPTQFWFWPELAGTQTQVKISRISKQLIDQGNANTNYQKALANKTHRLLLRAYHALSKSELGVAQDLAKKLSQLVPEVAAPLVIQGIALMQEGKRDQARQTLTVAKALDPEDQQIDQLLKALQ